MKRMLLSILLASAMVIAYAFPVLNPASQSYAEDTYRNESSHTDSYSITVSDVKSDTGGPGCANFHVGELREGAFTVMATLTDPSGIKEVKYAIWTENNGQDDLIWYPGYCTDNNNVYWARVNFNDHKGEKGTYTIHLYAYDNNDNLTNVGISYYFKETGPSISNVVVSDVTASGYTVTCTVNDGLGVLRVQFPTWTEKNGQDDIASEWNINTKVRGTKSGNKYTFRVNASEHNYETGIYYTHIYAYDILGNSTVYKVPSVNVHNHSWDSGIITEEATCLSEGIKTYTCTVCEEKKTESVPAKGVHKWDSGTITKPAQYFTEGVKTFKCSVCGQTKTASIPKLNINKVTPVKATIKSAKVKGKKLTLKWKRIAKNTKGYQIGVKDKKSGMTKYFNVKQSNKATISKVVKKLEKGRKYAIRVRAYNVVEGHNVYGPWSKAKSGKM